MLNKIGEGVQGVVHLAKWDGMNSVYKRMKPPVDEQEKMAFLKECEIWQYDFIILLFHVISIIINHRLVAHPSCVALYGVVNEGQEFGFVAEYCSNRSLYLFYVVFIS